MFDGLMKYELIRRALSSGHYYLQPNAFLISKGIVIFNNNPDLLVICSIIVHSVFHPVVAFNPPNTSVR